MLIPTWSLMTLTWRSPSDPDMALLQKYMSLWGRSCVEATLRREMQLGTDSIVETSVCVIHKRCRGRTPAAIVEPNVAVTSMDSQVGAE